MNNAQYTISALEITQINTTGEMKPTVWICGDSTVANYYNTADTSQHGWGQYLKDYINTNVFEVRNQATSGQYAKGFVDAGQFKPIEAYGKGEDGSADSLILSLPSRMFRSLICLRLGRTLVSVSADMTL